MRRVFRGFFLVPGRPIYHRVQTGLDFASRAEIPASEKFASVPEAGKS